MLDVFIQLSLPSDNMMCYNTSNLQRSITSVKGTPATQMYDFVNKAQSLIECKYWCFSAVFYRAATTDICNDDICG